MKFQYSLVLCLFIFGSCSQNTKHPQAEIINKSIPAAITEQSILHFADSVDANLNLLDKRSSLVYQLDESSSYIEQYSMNGIPVLYSEYTDNKGVKNMLNKYYFNNDSLVFINRSKKTFKENSEVFEERRIYLRNRIAFKQEIRASLSAANLKTKQFSAIDQADLSSENFTEKLKTLKDAIEGNEKFDLVFDSFLNSPNEKYILLRSKTPAGYNANILVTQNDLLIDSLIAEPMFFKDKKLKIKWEIINREAVYVPVAANATSANGLKR